MDKKVKPLTWDGVKVSKGKLVGMLTDDLAKAIFLRDEVRPNHSRITTTDVPTNTGRKSIRKY